jgi:hypothetical protein
MELPKLQAAVSYFTLKVVCVRNNMTSGMLGHSSLGGLSVWSLGSRDYLQVRNFLAELRCAAVSNPDFATADLKLLGVDHTCSFAQDSLQGQPNFTTILSSASAILFGPDRDATEPSEIFGSWKYFEISISGT